MKLSKVFELAKKNLARSREELSDKNFYICNSIKDTTAPLRDKARAIKIIEERLMGYHTLSQWLFAYYPNHRVGLTDGACMDKLQTTRHAWLTDLIREFEGKGN